MAPSTLSFFALAVIVGIAHCQRGREPRDQIPQACQRKVMDIFFILDSSTSIYILDYQRVLNFTKEIIERLDVDFDTTRVGALTFSDQLTIPILDFNSYVSKSDLISQINIDTLPYRTGNTNTHTAIKYVRELREFREDITKVIVVLTDGGSRIQEQTAYEVQEAKNNGFYFFVVGVGQYLDEQEWRTIASDPDDNFIFNITTYLNLDRVKVALPPRACSLPPILTSQRCEVRTQGELYFVAGNTAAIEAYEVISNFMNRTTLAFPLDSRYDVHVSYLLNACYAPDNAEFKGPNDYCEKESMGSGPQTYVQLLNKLQGLVPGVRQDRGEVNQVAVLFVDQDVARNV
ncbi:collagen alpha-1(XXI) chain-like, partial [Physella acuta]|uniref:collagen alpha-1(XXI) chain-like n=1 Tax=Physella acuta TaxID=109671 RepID=UPI0027DBE30B